MSFTPNSTNTLLTGQPLQAPQTSSTSNSSKNSETLQSATFANSQQPVSMSQIINSDNKNPMPALAQQQNQPISQISSNLGQESVPQHLISTQHNMNRSLNIIHQPTFQQQPQPTITSQKMNMFEQLQSVYKQQMVTMSGPVVPQNLPTSAQHSLAVQQDVLKKFQQTVPQEIQQTKLPPNQQQSKLAYNHPSAAISQQITQYSSGKPVHPQMKTTAKLASPGSQLQNLQKLTIAPNLLNITGHQHKTVPLITPLASLSLSQSTATSLQFPSQQINIGKSANVTSTYSKLATPPLAITTIPYLSSSTTVKTPPESFQKQTKAEEQYTEASPTPMIQIKLSKPNDEAIKDVGSPSQLVVSSNVDVNSANSKQPFVPNTFLASVPSTSEKTQAVLVKVTNTTATSSRSTMRLATVTPAKQKKHPTTNYKKLQLAPVVQKPQKILGALKPVSKQNQTAPKKLNKLEKTATKHLPAVVKTSNLTTSSAIASSVTGCPQAKTKRSRVKVQPYQIPTPEIAFVTKLSTQTAHSNVKNGSDDKLTIFYKNEFLAVRNGEDSIVNGFYLCQAMQNVYKSSSKIKIRWLNEVNEGRVPKNAVRVYLLDFYDVTDFDCVLTTVDLDKIDKSYELSKEEQNRISNILKKSFDFEKGVTPRPTFTEENPDGLDLSLYKDEAQLDNLHRKRKRIFKSADEGADKDFSESPRKKKHIEKSKNNSSIMKDADSTESDEENLMEVKKKVKRQASLSTASKTSNLKPMINADIKPSTSKAGPVSEKLGRKRGATHSYSNILDLISKDAEQEAVKEVKEVESSVLVKTSGRGVSAKKYASHNPGSIEKQETETNVSAKSAKKTRSIDEGLAKTALKSMTKLVSLEILQEKVSPIKLEPPALSTLIEQPSTSRSRKTRSRK